MTVVTGRRQDVFAAPADAVRATRIAGLLALAASVLGAVLAVGVSRWPAEQTVVLVALLGLVAAVGTFAVLAPDRVPPVVVVLSLLGGTAFTSLGMVVVGRAAVDGADNEMLFLVPVLFSAFYCRAWVGALVTSTASLTYAAAMMSLQVQQPMTRWLTTTVALAVVTVLVTASSSRDTRRLAIAFDEASRDPLTGLLNRRGLAAQFGTGMAGAKAVSLLLVDIDHFKAVNDSFGHAVGDEVLVRLAHTLQAGSRAADVVSRVGGEEFVLVFPGCEPAQAHRRATALCQRVAIESVAWPAAVTLSVGTASCAGAIADLPALLAAADHALYAAKSAGRNTVRASSLPTAS